MPTGRVASSARTASRNRRKRAAFMPLSPQSPKFQMAFWPSFQISLPIDQTTTDGWLRSRRTKRASTCDT